MALKDVVHGFGGATKEWAYMLPLVKNPAMNTQKAKPARALNTSNRALTNGTERLAKTTGHKGGIPVGKRRNPSNKQNKNNGSQPTRQSVLSVKQWRAQR